ncbi:MAG: endolytic transglycosylase MltG [Rhodospirillaceae bacterium]
MRRVIIVAAVLILTAAAGAGGAWIWLADAYERPGPSDRPVTVIVPKGVAPAAIAETLKAAGVIADVRIFKWGRRLFAEPKPLRAGEFEFAAAISAAAAVVHLQSGPTVVRKVTVAEGLTNAEVVDLLNRTPGLSGLPGPLPPEGRLLPETYHFSYGDSRAQVIARMRVAMAQLLAEAWPARAENLPLTSLDEALTRASIVEKETGVAGERPRVAGVFVNRLRKGMRLQSDPTVIYGLTQGAGALGHGLTRAELDTATPYNTYVVKGLPPTPIANPGRAAVLAVLNPAATKDLYFVADGTGGHVFAETLKAHLANVAKWRKIERARRNAGQ